MSVRPTVLLRAAAAAACAVCACSTYVGCAGKTHSSAATGDDASAPAPDDASAPMMPDATAGCPASNGQPPSDLRCTGLYGDWESKTVDPNVKPYTPGVILWSDGAQKSRYLYLPPGSQIDTSDMDNWSFPVGTRVWKEFAFGGQKIETRYFEKTAAAPSDVLPGKWIWGTYRWSTDQSTATFINNAVPDAGPDGYAIPAKRDCPTCHSGGKRDLLLGVEAFALGLPAATGETLTQLSSEGRFTIAPPAMTTHAPDDGKGSPEALAYLHINCGVSCHNDNVNSFCRTSGLYMRLSATDCFKSSSDADDVHATTAYKTAVGVAPTVFPMLYPPDEGWFRIASGDATHSELIALMGIRGTPAQMPAIATHVVDDAGIALVTSWVQAGP